MTCQRCGTELTEVRTSAPVTTAGFYGSYEIRWQDGRQVRFGPYCAECLDQERLPYGHPDGED